MLLFDQLTKQNPLLNDVYEGAVVVDSTAIYDYLSTNAITDPNCVLDLYPLVPPFEMMFIEWRRYGKWRTGMLVARLPMSHPLAEAIGTPTGLSGEPKWVLGCQWHTSEYPAAINHQYFAWLDATGRLLTYPLPDGRPFYATINPPPDEMLWTEASKAEWGGIGMGALVVSLWTLQFFHVKNIVIEDHSAPPALAKKHLRKNGRVPSDYKLVKLHPPREVTRKVGGIELEVEDSEEHHQRRWHMVKGHFRTYTEQAPLMGRAVGRFWFNESERGKGRQPLQHRYEAEAE